jgi:Flp pilus assembly protein TadG
MKVISQLSNFNKLDCGSSLIEVALVTPVLLLLLLGTFDFGLAFFTAIEVAGAAHAGAEYGIQNPSDSAGIQAAAIADAPDVSGLTISTSAYGCECSDGTAFSATCSSTPSCTNNVVYRVTVNASTTYKPLFPWPGIPSAIPLSQSATMRSGGS